MAELIADFEQALQDYIFTSKYARYEASRNRRDTWREGIGRVRDMHLRKHPNAASLIIEAFQDSEDKLVLGSQRGLQFGGEPIEKKNARIYNCTVSYCDRPRFFQEAMWLLLCGCGVGFSVQHHHVEKLPKLYPNRFEANRVIYQIKDSIEGWADALGVLLASYMPHPEYTYENSFIEFDYSLIREKGTPLTSGVGKAPGPKPLEKALEHIRTLLDRCIQNGQDKLRTIDCYDIVMFASEAVLSGGVRRSATICIFSPTDDLMMNAKTGKWLYENPQRKRSNNSALLLRDKTTKEEFSKYIDISKNFGEPGFLWADSTEIMFNPCAEIGMYPVLEKFTKHGKDITDEHIGKIKAFQLDRKEKGLSVHCVAWDIIKDVVPEKISGWAFCNLCEINGKLCTTKEIFYKACRSAAIIGTLQASYTDFDYLGPVTKAIVEREALLGVSITGMMDSPEVLFDKEVQQEGARIVRETNKEVAALIGIKQAARTTCVKPAGTTSCILGTSSGIHAHHSRRYIRRVQANELETPFRFFAKHNPLAVEKDVYNNDASVISFCIDTHIKARTRKEVNAIMLLEHVKLTQENWVEAGTNPELCAKQWLRHNVSNTINVGDNEWDEVRDYIYEHRNSFAGVALLSSFGDLDYAQAPFVAIHTPAEIVKMYGDGSLMASGLIVDGLHAFNDNLFLACDYASGVLTNKSVPFPEVESIIAQEDWIRRAKQFSERYFGGNIRQMTYCLKEVNNWKLWCDLKRETVRVDFTQLREDEDNTSLEEAVACAGGQCQI